MHAVTGIQMPLYRIEQMLFRDNWATAVYIIFIFYLMDLAPVHFDQSASSETKAGNDTDRGGRRGVEGVMILFVGVGRGEGGRGALEHLAAASSAIGGGRHEQPAMRLEQNVDLYRSTCRERLLSNESPARIPAFLPEVLHGGAATDLGDTVNA